MIIFLLLEFVFLLFISFNGIVIFYFIDFGILGDFFFELVFIFFLLVIMFKLDKKNILN